MNGILFHFSTTRPLLGDLVVGLMCEKQEEMESLQANGNKIVKKAPLSLKIFGVIDTFSGVYNKLLGFTQVKTGKYGRRNKIWKKDFHPKYW